MWSFHIMRSSKMTPKNFVNLFRFITLLLITTSGIFKIILSLIEGLLKKGMISFFFTFSDNLLALNQWLTLTNSVFTVLKSGLITL